MEMYERRPGDRPDFKIGDSVVGSQSRGSDVLLTIEGKISEIDDIYVTIKDTYGDMYEFDVGEITYYNG